MKWEPTSAEMMRAMLAVLMDKDTRTDCLFWHGSPTTSRIHNEQAACSIAEFRRYGTKNIVVNGLEEKTCRARNLAYPGHEVFSEILQSFGVSPKDVAMIHPSDHTAAESENLLVMAKERGWKSVTIVSAPHHQLRCFLQIIASMKKLGVYVKAHNRTFHAPLDWREPMNKPLLGGGEMAGTLVDHVQGEHDRIVKYADKDGLGFTPHATIPEMFEYLKIRDSM